MRHYFVFLCLLTVVNSWLLTEKENAKLQRQCGTKPNWHRRKIYNGIASKPQNAPWAIKLIHKSGRRCSATLISPRHILTAGHCFWKLPISGFEGSCQDGHLILYGHTYDFRLERADNSTINSAVVSVIRFNACTAGNTQDEDLAVVELTDDVQYSDVLFPVCIPKDNYNYIDYETPMYIYAYGKNTYDDSGRFGVLRTAAFKLIEWDSANKFDIYGTPAATRRGDSGSGAILEYDYQHYVVGVLSSGDGMTSRLMSVGYYYNLICSYTGIC